MLFSFLQDGLIVILRESHNPSSQIEFVIAFVPDERQTIQHVLHGNRAILQFDFPNKNVAGHTFPIKPKTGSRR
jgi:hypothetical protein